jgi:hypothetical protein
MKLLALLPLLAALTSTAPGWTVMEQDRERAPSPAAGFKRRRMAVLSRLQAV